MDREYEFKQEVAVCLADIKMTDQMKRNIRRTCSERKEKSTSSVNRKFKMKPVIAGLMTAVISVSSLMAMDYKLGLGLFFNSEDLSHAEGQVQSVQKYDEDANVKMEVNEAINQVRGAVISVNFINKQGHEWPKDIKCLNLKIKSSNGEDRVIGSAREYILSKDGKQLSYIAEIENSSILLNDYDLDVVATNLGTFETIEKDIDLSLDTCTKAKVGSMGFSTEALVKTLNGESKTNEQKRVIDKEFPTIELLGVGILTDTKGIEDGTKDTGIMLQVMNSEEPNIYRGNIGDTGNYLVARITEIMDTRTGKTYKEEQFVTKDCVKGFFPGVSEEQLPYLKAVKVEYTQQQVIEEGTWKVTFNMNSNEKNKLWKPEIQFKVGKEEAYTIYVNEVSLSTAGVQIKEYTIREKNKALLGDYNSNWLKVSLILDTGEKVDLESTTLSANMDKDGKHRGYIVSYYKANDPDWKLVDIKRVKQVIINDQIFENK